MQRIVGWTLIAALLSQGTLAAPGPQAQVSGFVQALEDTRRELDRLLDASALLDSADYEAHGIVDFVTREIAFQAYPGVLRGVQGTLAGRAGNAHDQALTLASLLKDAGYDAQILRAGISADQARQLNAGMAMAAFPDSRAEVDYPRQVQQLMEHARKDAVKVTDLMQQTDNVAEQLNERLEGSPLSGAGQQMTDAALASSRDYRWVRYRDGPATPWVEVHPALAAAADWSLAFSSAEAEQVDSADLQMLGMELWIENAEGERHSITGRWSAPAANLMGQELSVEIVSDAALRPELWLEPAQLVDGSRFFFAKINGAVPDEAQLFDLRGDTYSKAGLEGLDSLYSTMNEKGNQAIDALGDMGRSAEEADADAGRQLTKVWLNFHITMPGQPDRVIERTLYEGRAMADPRTAAATLLQRWDLDVTTTAAMPQAQERRKIDQLAATIEQAQRFQTYLANTPDAGNEDILERYARVIGNPSAARLSYLRTLFDQYRPAGDTVSYPHQPNVLAIRHGISHQDGVWKRYEMADIVANQRWSFAMAGNVPVADIGTNVARGVWETRAETLHLTTAEGRVDTVSAYDTLTGAANLTTAADPSGEFVNLVAARGPQAGDNTAWWQVDVATGSTVGMIDLGPGPGGAEIAERTLMEIIAYSISGAILVVGSATCIEGGGSVVCCIAANVGLTLLGLITSLVVGAVATAVVAGAWGVGVGASVLIDIGLTNVNVDCGQSA